MAAEIIVHVFLAFLDGVLYETNVVNTEVHAARALVLETARKRDDGQDVTMEASMCKLFASEMCGRVADRAVQVFGGGGYVSDNVAERFYRDVRLFRLYEGTSQIHLLNIAKRTLALAEQDH